MTLDRRILDIRLVAMLLIFLVASVALIPTWGPTQVQASGNAPCTGCGQKATTSSQNVKVGDVTILEGEERNNAIATALSSQDYKNVKQALVERGYTPQVDNATAQIIKLLINGTDEIEVLMVSIPFKGGAENSAGIIFAAFKNHTLAVGGIVDTRDETLIFSIVSVDGTAHGLRASQWEECWDDTDCKPLYGPEYCCYDGMCAECPPAPTCIEMDWPNYNNCMLWCTGGGALTCGIACYFLGPVAPLCGIACWFISTLICQSYCTNKHCLQWG